MQIKLKDAIGKAKDFLSTEAGFSRYSLELDEVSDAKDKWIISFYNTFPTQEEVICQVEVSKQDGEILSFKRVEVEDSPDT